jgi:prepilin-type N-terminal cleavage/methylation domain-containing protein
MKRGSEGGFTIIETLIVLAIAGLIFLIIFEAIPALERNSRNGERKQDVAAVLSAISEYQLRNSGNFPPVLNPYAALTDPTTGVGTIDLSYYDPGAITIDNDAAGGAAIDHGSPGMGIDSMVVANFHLCDGPGATSVAAGYRDIVAVYEIESGSSSAVQCQQL